MESDRELSANDAASMLGVTPGTWHTWVSRRQAPSPTGRRLGRPTWKLFVIDEWFPPVSG